MCEEGWECASCAYATRLTPTGVCGDCPGQQCGRRAGLAHKNTSDAEGRVLSQAVSWAPRRDARGRPGALQPGPVSSSWKSAANTSTSTARGTSRDCGTSTGEARQRVHVRSQKPAPELRRRINRVPSQKLCRPGASAVLGMTRHGAVRCSRVCYTSDAKGRR